MKQEPIIIKVAKEKQATYHSNTKDFETLRYEEVGKSWLLNKKRELSEWLNNTHQLLTRAVQVIVVKWQVITGNPLVKKTVRGVIFWLVVIKDVLYVVYVLLTGILIFGLQVLGGAFKSPPRNTTHKRTTTTKPFEPPIDDEWWRERPKPKPAKKTRIIRVIVEVEDI
jgi:hypothetical protein